MVIRVIPVLEEDLEEDDDAPDGDNGKQPFPVHDRGDPGACPEDDKESKEDCTHGVDHGRIGDRHDGDDDCKREDDLHAGIQPVHEDCRDMPVSQ